MGAASAGFVRRSEPIKWTVNAMVDKWEPSQVDALRRELGREPTGVDLVDAFAPEHIEHPDNMLTTAGLGHIMNRIVGTAGTMQLDNTHTRLGVGNSNAPESVGQTDLSAIAGAANRYIMTMDTVPPYPTVSGGVLTARATFGAADANFTWNEWGLVVTTNANAVAGTTVTPGTDVLINRKVAALGAKSSGSVWQLTVTLTLA